MKGTNGQGGRMVATATVDRIPEDASFSEVVWSAPHSTPGEALTELLELAEQHGVDELVGVQVVTGADLVPLRIGGEPRLRTEFTAYGTIIRTKVQHPAEELAPRRRFWPRHRRVG